MVLVKMRARLSCEAGTTIIHSFAVTNILQLKPPSTTEAAAHAYVSAIQIRIRRKLFKLSIFRENTMLPTPIQTIKATDPYDIIRPKTNNLINLLI